MSSDMNQVVTKKMLKSEEKSTPRQQQSNDTSSHDIQKRYHCDDCDFTFSNQQNYQRHEKYHQLVNDL